MERIDYLQTLFSGADQSQNFQKQREIFPTSEMTRSPVPMPFPVAGAMTMPKTYVFEGRTCDVDSFLEGTQTMALLVLKDGAIRHEHYAEWGGPDRHWLSMSVAKSFVSAAVGIAIDEGLIQSVEQPITDYLPALGVPGSAYAGVRIKDILQMSSGAGWNEDYSDPQSDIARLGAVMALGGAMDDFPPTLTRAREPGSFNLYNSTDTQVLGMLLVAATGRTIADYMQEKLWNPLGMESEGYWITDSTGMEMAFGGLNAIARDYAKIGELFRLEGNWHGKQIVSADWIRASVSPDAPHLIPGKRDNSDSVLGYGYQWWVFDGDDGDYSAIGVYNQFVYVNPAKNVVIVKLSATQSYGLTNDETSYRELETIEMLRAVAAAA